MQLARGLASTTISKAKNACPRGRNETFAMIDSVAAVFGLVSAGIFLAHAIESYRARRIYPGAKIPSVGDHAPERLTGHELGSWNNQRDIWQIEIALAKRIHSNSKRQPMMPTETMRAATTERMPFAQ